MAKLINALAKAGGKTNNRKTTIELTEKRFFA
jgi:hypothetical protein